jgi:hypothetical protein
MEFAIYGLTSTNTFYFKIRQLLTSPAPLQQPIQMLKEFSLVMVVIMKQHQIYYHYLQHQIEVWVNGAFKANINIKRMESNCGIYLKWFNANGYSYWLFDKFYSDTTSKNH